MENLSDPAVQAWFKAQDDHARTTLARLPGRAELAKRVATLSEAGTIVYDVVNRGRLVIPPLAVWRSQLPTA